MGFFGNIFKAAVRGVKGLTGKAYRGLKSAGEKAMRGVKSGYQKVKGFITGKSAPAPPAEPKLSTTLRNRGAFKPKAQLKVPYEPPIKLRNPKPPINKGRALNDPI